ncbi:hypothetical protein [Proteiniphilum sp. X52]|uniref:hypothetical protein n=1 Tax=Proteiniphilum sp. X52 TaxID=2382159 RepID=UPI000F0A78C2|nr:hypothetical protein [Proteiniphilum sp. X52]RNC66467.1 hypothetical protein D7D25_03025 [Proteiniphilum sp. X52]
MITGKYCFVQFSETMTGCEVPLPVRNLSDLRFFFDTSITNLNVDVVSINGAMLREFVHSFNYFATGLDLGVFMNPGRCFRLKLTNKTTNEVYYSNVFMYLPNCGYPLLKYWCSKDEFGFHYEPSRMNWIRLPLILDKPNYNENKTEYTDSNGKTRILHADIRKKYRLQTDYMPESMHDKLKIALSHDLVTFNDVEYVETGSYKILEEIFDYDCVEGYMGETEVAVNFVERNTNC